MELVARGMGAKVRRQRDECAAQQATKRTCADRMEGVKCVRYSC